MLADSDGNKIELPKEPKDYVVVREASRKLEVRLLEYNLAG